VRGRGGGRSPLRHLHGFGIGARYAPTGRSLPLRPRQAPRASRRSAGDRTSHDSDEPVPRHGHAVLVREGRGRDAGAGGRRGRPGRLFPLSRLTLRCHICPQDDPHAIAVYASRPLSTVAAHHSLPSGRYSLLGPDFHRLDRTSFAWRTHSITSSARVLACFRKSHARAPTTLLAITASTIVKPSSAICTGSST